MSDKSKCFIEGCGFKIVLCENDGLAWLDENDIVINARWLTNHPPDISEIIEEINRSIIHELIEHIIGLGHKYAVYAEELIFGSSKFSQKKY